MNEKPRDNPVSRRRMLARLGLTATAIYAAPMLTTLSEARASGGGSGGSGGGSGGSGGSSSGASGSSSTSSSGVSGSSGMSGATGPTGATWPSGDDTAEGSSPSNVGGLIGIIQRRMQN